METFIKNSSKNNRIGNFKNAMLLFMLMVLSCMQCMAESDALIKMKEDAEHRTQMGYVFMIGGFIVIMAIAWFSVKKKKGENQQQQHPPVAHHHHHSIHDKRYGTHHAK